MSNSEISEVEKHLWEELWGCVNYLKIPYDTLLSMPVYIRKFWIMKHNEANSQEVINGGNNSSTIDGQAINSYAYLEQANRNTPK